VQFVRHKFLGTDAPREKKKILLPQFSNRALYALLVAVSFSWCCRFWQLIADLVKSVALRAVGQSSRQYSSLTLHDYGGKYHRSSLMVNARRLREPIAGANRPSKLPSNEGVFPLHRIFFRLTPLSPMGSYHAKLMAPWTLE
jgi:hypothetical protein